MTINQKVAPKKMYKKEIKAKLEETIQYIK